MTESSSASAAWPSARRTNSVVVAHPAWEAVRNGVLDQAAKGPVTVVLLGAPGTGKSWMLRELAGCLGDHGFPTTMLMQGDLPFSLGDGAALLVDETLRMPEPYLDDLLTQDRGVVVLADVERFGERVAMHLAEPLVLTIRRLTDVEVVAFAADWLQQSGLPTATVEPAALAQVIAHAGGTVRLVVQLLAAATALGRMEGRPVVTAADVDGAAAMRQSGMSPPVTDPVTPSSAAPFPAPAPQPSLPKRASPRHRVGRRTLVATTAVAACVALAWTLGNQVSSPAMPPRTSVAVLPPLRPAELFVPSEAEAVAPMMADTAVPAPRIPLAEPLAVAGTVPPKPAVTSTETLNSGPGPIATAEMLPVPKTVSVSPRMASAVPEAAAHVSSKEEVVVAGSAPPAGEQSQPPGAVVSSPADALPSKPVEAAEIPPTRRTRPAGAAGIVLLAQPGDTLESLYRDFYRNREAPPYAEVVAVNPRPVKPGGIVIFPEPPGGWSGQR